MRKMQQSISLLHLYTKYYITKYKYTTKITNCTYNKNGNRRRYWSDELKIYVALYKQYI